MSVLKKANKAKGGSSADLRTANPVEHTAPSRSSEMYATAFLLGRTVETRMSSYLTRSLALDGASKGSRIMLKWFLFS